MNLESCLKKYFGYNDFRAHQKEIIQHICDRRDVLAILPTGAGKSLCYQLPAMMLPGITLVVSPLISLMQDQVASLNKSGIPATFLNSSLHHMEAINILHNLSDYKLLFIAPERFSNEQFQEHLKGIDVSMIAIDEAHCISQWGHSFRPEYRQLSFLKEAFPDSPVLALTATATPEVEKDITAQMTMNDPVVIKSSFDRPNLTIRINEKRNNSQQLHEFLKKHEDQSGIIYCATRKGVEATYAELKVSGHNVSMYHAGMTDGIRATSQHDFIYDKVKLMVATVAFGMGIHKPDIRFIVHMDMPKTIEQYYQEIGRAGRDGLPSECLMLQGWKEMATYRFFIDQLVEGTEKKELGKKLNQMLDLCTSPNCRRSELLNYFGESYSHPVCKNCDNCLDDIELIDGSIIAQKILSCIHRLQQNFGNQMVIDVLRGSKNQKVLARGFDKLSTHNLMHEYSEEELRYYINTLIHLGYLCRSEGEYPVLQWTESSQAVIKGETEVKFRKKSFRESKRVDTLAKEHDTSLFETLRQLRLKISRDESVPPFVVFPDRSLMEMAKHLPQSRETFLQINGVGPHKWKRYGEKFLEVILQHKPKEPRQQKNQSEKNTLELYQNGKSMEDICTIRSLTMSTVSGHLVNLMNEGVKIEIDRLVSKEKQMEILAAIEKVGAEKCKPLKEILPEEISYEEIRLVQTDYNLCRR